MQSAGWADVWLLARKAFESETVETRILIAMAAGLCLVFFLEGIRSSFRNRHASVTEHRAEAVSPPRTQPRRAFSQVQNRKRNIRVIRAQRATQPKIHRVSPSVAREIGYFAVHEPSPPPIAFVDESEESTPHMLDEFRTSQ